VGKPLEAKVSPANRCGAEFKINVVLTRLPEAESPLPSKDEVFPAQNYNLKLRSVFERSALDCAAGHGVDWNARFACDFHLGVRGTFIHL
jgi:hypothetical protein